MVTFSPGDAAMIVGYWVSTISPLDTMSREKKYTETVISRNRDTKIILHQQTFRKKKKEKKYILDSNSTGKRILV